MELQCCLQHLQQHFPSLFFFFSYWQLCNVPWYDFTLYPCDRSCKLIRQLITDDNNNNKYTNNSDDNDDDDDNNDKRVMSLG